MDEILEQEELLDEEEILDEDITEGEEAPEESDDKPNEEKPVDEPKRQVPLKTFLQEKQKRKDLEKRLKELETAERTRDEEKEKARIKERLIARGYDEVEAEEEAEDIYFTREMARQTKKEIEEKAFKSELKELAASDTLFKDIELYSDDIKAKMKQVKGISAEEAFILLRGKLGRKEYQTDVEQRNAIARRNAAASAVSNSQGGKITASRLDDNDRKALANLKKMQPDAKWDEKKYIQYMKTQ